MLMKITDTSGLATTTVLNTEISQVENKISIHHEYITTPEFNKLTVEKFKTRLKQATLMSKTNFDNKLTSFQRKIKQNKTKSSEIPKKLNSLITKYYIFLAKFILQMMMDLKTRWFINQHTIR